MGVSPTPSFPSSPPLRPSPLAQTASIAPQSVSEEHATCQQDSTARKLFREHTRGRQRATNSLNTSKTENHTRYTSSADRTGAVGEAGAGPLGPRRRATGQPSSYKQGTGASAGSNHASTFLQTGDTASAGSNHASTFLQIGDTASAGNNHASPFLQTGDTASAGSNHASPFLQTGDMESADSNHASTSSLGGLGRRKPRRCVEPSSPHSTLRMQPHMTHKTCSHVPSPEGPEAASRQQVACGLWRGRGPTPAVLRPGQGCGGRSTSGTQPRTQSCNMERQGQGMWSHLPHG